MKKLSETSVAPVSEARLRHFARWRVEWTIDRALDAADAAPGPAPVRLPRRPRRTPRRRKPFDAEPGRIWLADPSLVPGCHRPLYLVVAAAPEDGWVRMAPLGEFAAPATDGELLLRHPAGELRVVCLWNTRRLPESTLSSGWPAGRLRADDTADIRTGLDCLAALRPFPPDLRDRTGPSLSAHPDDPRGPYLDAETRRLDALADAAVAGMDLASETASDDAGDVGQLAAEPKTRDRYGGRSGQRPDGGETDDRKP